MVSVVFGHKEGEVFHIDQWLMSCRVLKRDLEFAMMDELVRRCRNIGVRVIRGYYYPTRKNKMVQDFYRLQGFDRASEDEDGNSVWNLDISEGYQDKNDVIGIGDREL